MGVERPTLLEVIDGVFVHGNSQLGRLPGSKHFLGGSSSSEVVKLERARRAEQDRHQAVALKRYVAPRK